LADLFDSGTAETLSVVELEQYLNSNENASSGLLSFWEGKEEVWPKLSQCAQWVMSTPACHQHIIWACVLISWKNHWWPSYTDEARHSQWTSVLAWTVAV